MAASVDKLLSVAYEEVGYLEKRSNSQLDSKTANAGENNYTKYWRDMDPSLQSQPWCCCFCCWCFKRAYGEAIANKLMCGGLYEFYTPESAQYFKNKGQWYTSSPKKGDVIYFKNSERIHHVGIVVEATSATVYTIEGNTSAGEQVIPNGGAVCKKSYAINNPRIAGYGRPKYDNVSSSGSTSSTPAEPESTLNELAKYHGYVTASSLNVRTGPGADFDKVSFSPLPNGTKVGVCDELESMEGDKWYYISYNGKHGFVSAAYISKSSSDQTESKKKMTAEDISVAALLKSAKTVMDKAQKEGWQHGTTKSKVPCKDGVISGVSLVARALYDLGFTDQISGGETYKTLDKYLQLHGFKRSTKLSAIRKGSIVLVKHEGKNSVSHAFIALSFVQSTLLTSRYDAGTQQRIETEQPLKNVKWTYKKDDVIVYNLPSSASAWTPCQADYKAGLLRIFETPSSTARVLRRIPYGGKMETDGKTSGIFVHVRNGNVEGWAKERYVKR